MNNFKLDELTQPGALFLCRYKYSNFQLCGANLTHLFAWIRQVFYVMTPWNTKPLPPTFFFISFQVAAIDTWSVLEILL